MTSELRKAGANWVDGDRFFDREPELAVLRERVSNGTHTLVTAQRRMGKTSLVRELLRRLEDEGAVTTLFVDLEGAGDAADAVAEIAIQARTMQRVWTRILENLANRLEGVRGHIDEVGFADLRIKLRAGIDAGSWQRTGDQVFEALAANDRPVVLAIDELPILVNRMLKGQNHTFTAESRDATDHFLSWLRRNGQEHRDRVCMIVSGSVGLEPILQQAGLSAQVNIFAPFELRPWTEEVATDCLAALARNYGLDVATDVRTEMCRRLRCCIPHHVQRFFAHLHEHLLTSGRRKATIDDIDEVYRQDLLGIHGQIDMQHYESRLLMVLGKEGYELALELLTEAAVNDGTLKQESLRKHIELVGSQTSEDRVFIRSVLDVLEHDGYLERDGNDYRFVSGLLEDWWSDRYGRSFIPVAERQDRK